MSAANFVNASVYSSSYKRTILPWTITPIPEIEYTFRDFFNSVLLPKLPSTSSHCFELISSHVGPKKDSVDSSQPVITSFGKYLKYIDTTSHSIDNRTSSKSTRNAFEILMNSARSQANQTPDNVFHLPITERNHKDKLYNDISHFISSTRGLY